MKRYIYIVILLFTVVIKLIADDININTDKISIKFANTQNTKITNKDIPQEISNDVKEELRDEWKEIKGISVKTETVNTNNYIKNNKEVKREEPVLSKVSSLSSAPLLNRTDGIKLIAEISKKKTKDLSLILSGKKTKYIYPDTINLRAEDFAILREKDFISAIEILNSLDPSHGFKENYYMMKKAKSKLRSARSFLQTRDMYFYDRKNDVIYLYYLGYMHELIGMAGFDPDKFLSIARSYYSKAWDMYKDL